MLSIISLHAHAEYSYADCLMLSVAMLSIVASGIEPLCDNQIGILEGNKDIP
jgi:hypothetical protein